MTVTKMTDCSKAAGWHACYSVVVVQYMHVIISHKTGDCSKFFNLAVILKSKCHNLALFVVHNVEQQAVPLSVLLVKVATMKPCS